MTDTISVQEYLKFAAVQMAAEALFGFDPTQGLGVEPSDPANALIHRFKGDIDSTVLESGNTRSSKFTETDATAFAAKWEVVEHIPNTSTGFSGTLFKDKATGELVLSFRSTEFIDDSTRDNTATNNLEIRETGFAWGQIDDMQTWFADLESRGLITAPLTVTGYSLGGHLATAFNLLHKGETAPNGEALVKQVYTFNGAGIGRIDGRDPTTGTLTTVIGDFQSLRAKAKSGTLASELGSAMGRAAYVTLKTQLAGNGGAPSQAILNGIAALFEVPTNRSSGLTLLEALDKQLLTSAVERLLAIKRTSEYVANLTSGSPDSLAPDKVELSSIAAYSLDYQVAVLLAQRHGKTSDVGLKNSLFQTFDNKYISPYGLANQIDVVGTEMAGGVSLAMVANSQVHYGRNQAIFIEDQPLTRGSAVLDGVLETIGSLSIRLLVDQYAKNDFGDTHSLVLLIDSLKVQNLLQTLSPDLDQGTINQILKTASYLRAKSVQGQQGSAEGDVLEWVVNALADVALGPGHGTLKGNPAGGTWAERNIQSGYSGRMALHELISQVELSGLFSQARNNGSSVSMQASGVVTIEQARSDAGAYLALLTLSPFQFGAPASGDSLLDWLTSSGPWSIQPQIRDWKADKTRLDAGETITPGNPLLVTEQWLTDRASFLERKNFFGANNLNPVNLAYQFGDTSFPYLNDSTYFEDVSSGYKIQQGARFNNTQTFYFGDDESNQNWGTSGANNSGVSDHLYGGGGQDSLKGGDGGDHIEGNSGNDSLLGESGQDTLLGGSGNDTLDGGADNDLLLGGIGQDTYNFSGSYGWDEIIDQLGEGSIVVNGQALPVDDLLKLEDGSFTNLDTGWMFTKLNVTVDNKASLAIWKQGDAANRITINNWTNGTLGISLAEGTQEEQTGISKFNGDQRAPIAGSEPEYKWNLTEWNTGTGQLIGGIAELNFNDVIEGTGGKDEIMGLGGNDALGGGGGDDTIEGGEGSDLIGGGAGTDLIHGGVGNDYIATAVDMDAPQREKPDEEWEVPVNRIALIQGNTWGVYTYVGSVLGAWEDGVNFDVPSDTDGDFAFGEEGKDTLLGGGGNDYLSGGTEDDDVLGSAGDDVVLGGDGHDYLDGDARIDEIYAAYAPPDEHGDDLVDGGKGDDTIRGGGGHDQLYGGTGDDSLIGDYRNEPDHTAGQGHGNDLLDGGDGADSMYGAGKDDTLLGGKGDDVIWGDDYEDELDLDAHGDDYLEGEEGADVLVGGGGDDTLFGGENGDTLIGDGWVASDPDTEASGNDLLDGGDAADTLIGGRENDTLIGGDGDDFLNGDDSMLAVEFHGDDSLTGGDGEDVIFGGDGKDILEGCANSDALFGDGGDDTLVGGAGIDRLKGGKDNDVYLFDIGDAKNDDGGEATVETIEDSDGKNKVVLGGGIGFLGMTAGVVDGQFRIGSDDLGILSIVSRWKKGFSFEFKDTGETLTAHQVISRTAENVTNFADDEGRDNTVGTDSDDDIEVGGSPSLMSMTSFLESGDQGAGDPLDMSPIVYAGQGNDVITSSEAGLTILYSQGDGTDIIQGTRDITGVKKNSLEFGEGIDAEDVTLSIEGTGIRLRFANNQDDAIYIGGFDPLNGDNAGASIDELVFADGQIRSVADEVQALLATPATEGNDVIVGGDDADTIDGLGGEDHLFGAEGDDSISGGDGNDDLSGGAGDDLLQGGAGADTLFGGTGHDTLQGGSGADTYVLYPLPGQQQTITDDDAGSILRFDSLIESQMQRHQDLSSPGAFSLVTGTSAVNFQNLSHWREQTFQFADGTVANGAAVLDRLARRVDGSDGADDIAGSVRGDTLNGNDGDDTLDGGNGGEDHLAGGLGDDTYKVHFDGGDDRILDSGGTLSLDATFDLSDLVFQKVGGDLVLRSKQNLAFTTTLQDYFNGGSAWLVAHDGQLLSLDALYNQQSVDTAMTQDQYADIVRAEYIRKRTASLTQGYTLTGDTYKSVSTDSNHNVTESTISFGSEAVDASAPSQTVRLRQQLAYTSSQSQLGTVTVTEKIIQNHLTEPPSGGGFFLPNPLYNVPTRVGRYNKVTDHGDLSYSDNPPPFIFVPWTEELAQIFQTQTVSYQTVHIPYYKRTTETVYAINDIQGNENDNVIHIEMLGWPDEQFVSIDAGAGNDLINLDKPNWDSMGSTTNMLIAGDLPAGYRFANDHFPYTGSGGYIYGNEGDDTIFGGMGADDIVGGKGNDTLNGGSSGDHYYVGKGSGHDIVFDGGVRAIMVHGWEEQQPGEALPVIPGATKIGPNGTPLDIYGQTYYGLTRDALLAIDSGDWPIDRRTRALRQLYGSDYAEVPTANDHTALQGWFGADGVPLDNLHFGEGIMLDHIRTSIGSTTLGGVTRETLDIHWGDGENDSVSVVLPGANDPIGLGIERFVFFDGTVLNMAEMLAWVPPDPTPDIIEGTSGNDGILGTDQDDIIDAGQGWDTITGGGGWDTIILNHDSGIDFIMADGLPPYEQGENILLLDTPIDSGDYIAYANFDDPDGVYDDLVMARLDGFTEPTAGAIIEKFFDPEVSPIQFIEFSDGSRWDPDLLHRMAFDAINVVASSTLYGDPEETNDDLIGTESGDRFFALGGDDAVWGMGGDDFIYAGRGDDYVESGDGADMAWGQFGADEIHGGLGDDTVYGGEGADSLYGDEGDDELLGGEGNDFYAGGSGYDVFKDTSTTSDDFYMAGTGESIHQIVDAGGNDTVGFAAGITADQIWLTRWEDELAVYVIGDFGGVYFSDWFSNPDGRVEQFLLDDGKTLSANQVQSLVDAMAAFDFPPEGATTLPSDYQAALGLIIAASWV